MSKADEIGVIGAVYDIETGKVTFSEMLTKDKVEHAGEIAHLLEWKTVSRVASAGSH
jgi:hypothetical protein